jgi:hypothetical protein
MAARFGATIVPFGAVGEDDISEVSLCYFNICIYIFVFYNFREIDVY